MGKRAGGYIIVVTPIALHEEDKAAADQEAAVKIKKGSSSVPTPDDAGKGLRCG